MGTPWRYAATRAAFHVDGGAITDGGTTQAGGVNTAPNIDIDVAAILEATVNGIAHEIAVTADVDSDAGDQLVWGAESAKEASGYVLLETGSANDTPAFVIVFGDVAATGASEYPDDDAIDDAVTHENWTKIGGIVVERTDAATITVVVDHTVGDRNITGVATSFATTESGFRSTGG